MKGMPDITCIVRDGWEQRQRERERKRREVRQRYKRSAMPVYERYARKPK